MILFKTDIILNKNYPGIEHSSMLNLPMYEYLLKLKLIKEHEEEISDKQNSTNTDKEISKYMNQANSMVPKISSTGSIPSMKFPKIK